jgi:hypothetical protein
MSGDSGLSAASKCRALPADEALEKGVPSGPRRQRVSASAIPAERPRLI